MKKWLILVALIFLAGTNAITLWALAKSADRYAAARNQNTAAARALAVAAEDVRLAQFKTENAERQLSQLKGSAEPIIGEALHKVVDEWRGLYEQSQIPLHVGDRIEFYTVSAIFPDRIEASAGRAHKVYAWPDVPVAWRSRVALTLLGATTAHPAN